MAPARPSTTDSNNPCHPSSQFFPKISQSRLSRPAPSVATATALTASTRLYSQPSLTMKKPLGRCTVQAATSINDTKPAAGIGVSSPAARPSPADTSVVAAMVAWNLPGFMPMLSNHRAVPGIRPPPKNLLKPCKASVSPSTSRRINNPTSYTFITANLDHRSYLSAGSVPETGKELDIDIAIIGTGNVGSALGTAWRNRGHQVTFGVRNPDDPKYASLGTVGTNESAAVAADVVVLCTPRE